MFIKKNYFVNLLYLSLNIKIQNINSSFPFSLFDDFLIWISISVLLKTKLFSWNENLLFVHSQAKLISF